VAGFARERHERLHLRFGNFPRIHAGNTTTAEVYLHHDAVCLGRRLLEERFEHVDDELHRRVVVVEEHHVIKRRLLDFFVSLFFDGSAGLILVSRPASHTYSVAHVRARAKIAL